MKIRRRTIAKQAKSRYFCRGRILLSLAAHQLPARVSIGIAPRGSRKKVEIGAGWLDWIQWKGDMTKNWDSNYPRIEDWETEKVLRHDYDGIDKETCQLDRRDSGRPRQVSLLRVVTKNAWLEREKEIENESTREKTNEVQQYFRHYKREGRIRTKGVDEKKIRQP